MGFIELPPGFYIDLLVRSTWNSAGDFIEVKLFRGQICEVPPGMDFEILLKY